MHHRAHAADDADALAVIHLSVLRADAPEERECFLFIPRSLQPDIILHHRVAAGIPVLGPQPLGKSAWPCGAALAGAPQSASRIASITGVSGPSFGFSGGFVRR